MTAMLAICLAPAFAAGLGLNHHDAGSVILTSARPVAWIAIDAADAAGRLPVLELTVTRVVNAAAIPISLIASLERTGRGSEARTPGRIGAVTFFPPDQPGRYLLDAAAAFRGLEAEGVSPGERLKLRLEIRRVHEQQDWSGIEVVVAPPRWRSPTELRNPPPKP
jgi:hypothetical protein